MKAKWAGLLTLLLVPGVAAGLFALQWLMHRDELWIGLGWLLGVCGALVVLGMIVAAHVKFYFWVRRGFKAEEPPADDTDDTEMAGE